MSRMPYLGTVSRKKIAVLLDFVQMRGGGGGPCPNFVSTFHKLYILGQFGDGEGGGHPCPNFLAPWRSKKVLQVVQIRGRGGGGVAHGAHVRGTKASLGGPKSWWTRKLTSFES